MLNAGALTHTSLALRRRLRELTAPLVEVHLSNVFAREPVRHHSFVSPHAAGVLVGMGPQGYVLALSFLAATTASTLDGS